MDPTRPGGEFTVPWWWPTFQWLSSVIENDPWETALITFDHYQSVILGAWLHCGLQIELTEVLSGSEAEACEIDLADFEGVDD